MPLLLGQTTLDDATTARIDDGGTKAVFDYFGYRVFDALPPEQQSFLLQVAHLPEMTGAMATGLTGQADAGRLLAQWERKQFFIAREGDGTRNTRYRFHDLFRDFLLTTARQEWSESALNQVRGQAAVILEQAGEIEAAAHLYQTMEAWPALTQLLLTQAPDLLAHSRFATLANWLAWFPESLLRDDPWLSLWQGTALTFVQPELAAPWFVTALDHFATHGPLEAAWNAWCGRLECAQLLQKGLEDPGRWGGIQDQLLRMGEIPPSMEARILNGQLFLHMFGNPAAPDVGKIVDRLMLLSKDQPHHQKVATYNNILFNMAFQSGDHARSGLFWLLLTQEVPQDLPPLLLLQLESLRAFCAILSWRMTDARKSAHEIQRLCQRYALPVWAAILLEHIHTMIGISHDDYNLESSPGYLTFADDSSFLGAGVGEMLSMLQIGEGEYAQAILRMQTTAQNLRQMGVQISASILNLSLANAFFQTREREKAWDIMAAVARQAEEHANPVLYARHDQLATIFCLDENRRADAMRSLERALTVMEQSGQTQISGWGPGRAMRLVRLAMEENIHVPFIQRMLGLWSHLRPTPEMQPQDNWPWPVRLRTLGGLEIIVQGKPLAFRGKSQGKPLDLLKLILARNGRKAPVAAMADLLWPDAEGDLALGTFNTTLHRLRKLLDSPDCLLLGDGEISLNPEVCQLDLWVVEELAAQGDAAIQRQDDESVVRIFSRLLACCRGSFLESDAKNSWVIPARQQWRSQITRIIARIGSYLEKIGRTTLAEEGYRRALEWDGLSEGLHQQLMQCLARQGRIPEAMVAYRRCRSLFEAVLGKSPSPETERIYKQWEGKNG